MSGDDEMQYAGASASQQPFMPAALSMTKALIIEGNLEIFPFWGRIKNSHILVLDRRTRFRNIRRFTLPSQRW